MVEEEIEEETTKQREKGFGHSLGVMIGIALIVIAVAALAALGYRVFIWVAGL